MRRSTVGGAATVLALLALGCAGSVQPEGTEVTLTVADHTVECTGAHGTQQCLQVREAGEESWTLLYDSIEGFDYEEGYRYRIRVLRRERSEPPQDGSSVVYELLEVLSKEEGGG